MAVISGWVALGTGFPKGTFNEVSGGSYAREVLSLSGTVSGGLTQALSSIAAATAPAGDLMRVGAMFDALTGGNMIAWWEWATPTAVGTAFPATTINIAFVSGVYADFNAGDVFPAGAMIGTVNGNPMVAGSILQVQGGLLQVQQAAAAKVIESPLFTVGGVNVGRFDASGNLYLKGSIFAGATTITAIGTNII